MEKSQGRQRLQTPMLYHNKTTGTCRRQVPSNPQSCAHAVRARGSDGHQNVLFRLAIPTCWRIGESKELGVLKQHKHKNSKQTQKVVSWTVKIPRAFQG